jgi:hypothetical protein
MRQGNPNKRMRGRGGGGNGGGGGGGTGRKGPNPLTRSYESTGPDVKIRGTAHHIAEKYVTLARDAQSSGDRVLAENYLQHAEHYYRLIAAAQAQLQQPIQIVRSDIQTEDEDDDDLDTAVDVRANYVPAVPAEAPQPFVEDTAMERIQPERPQGFQPRPERQERPQGDRPERQDRPQDRSQGERYGNDRYGERRFNRDRNTGGERPYNSDRPRGDFAERPARTEQPREPRPERSEREEGGEGFRNRDRRYERGERPRREEGERTRVNVEAALPTEALPAFITARRAPAPAPVPVEPAPKPVVEEPVAAAPAAPIADLATPVAEEAPAPKKRARGTRGRGRKAEAGEAAETPAPESVTEGTGEE